MNMQQFRSRFGILLGFTLLAGAGNSTSNPPMPEESGSQDTRSHNLISSVALSSGSGNVVVPTGANYVYISAVGAGGGGGGATSGGTDAAGGGAGGAIVGLQLPVTPGDLIPYTVGQGGIGGGSSFSNQSGGNGTATTLGEIVLNGGTGGQTGQSAVGGNGGSVVISGTVLAAGATGVSGAGVAGKFANLSFLAFGGASGGGVTWGKPTVGGGTFIYKGGIPNSDYSSGGGASALAAGGNALQAGSKGSGGGGGGNRLLGANGGDGFILLEFYS